jgi:hypothetical protein
MSKKIILVDERIPFDCERSLLVNGFRVIKLPGDSLLGEAVRSHPDTLLFASDNEIITTADYCDTASYIFSDLREEIPELKITFTADDRSGGYPNDCIMNALIIADKLFCKTDSVSKEILEFAKRNNYQVIHTNQGYPACTVLSFENSAITSDKGMAKTLNDCGIKVLEISSGHVSLYPHEYGFIGGASFYFDKKVYFFGDVSKHPQGELICEAIRSEGLQIVSLSNAELVDLGGAFVFQTE